jgi:hypothetical protein
MTPPAAKVILSTHVFLDHTGVRVGSGVDVWNNVIKTHDNVLMVNSGHYFLANASHRTDNSDGGVPVHQMFLNGHSGYPFIRMLTVRPAAKKIMVQTFNPLFRKFWSDSGMNFDLDIL